MAQIWKATKKTFDKWHLVKGSRRLMTLKKVKVRYDGRERTVKEPRVRFFNSKATAIKEARRLNVGGVKRKGNT